MKRCVKFIFMLCSYTFILLVLFLSCLDTAPAFSFSFITEEEFASEKSVYKDYPLRILFRKLDQSTGPEKRKIRNIIILKQVFDRNIQDKMPPEALKYNKAYGIIEDISKDKLKIYIPETNSYKDCYLGIDRIPLEDENNYTITELNINKYASIIYTLDNRIYKVHISFQIAAPSQLSVKRIINENIIDWNEPLTAKKPSSYKVFLNGKPFKTVEDTTVKVPITKGKVDKFYVKATYKHGGGVIDSDASDVIFDQIAAAEKKNKLLATETYNTIVVALNPSEWKNARKLLYDNRRFLAQQLDDDPKANTEKLIVFFREIDKGDQTIMDQPLTTDNLASSLMFYERAQEKAEALSDSIDVAFIAQLKINENNNLRPKVEAEKQQLLAAETYNKILDGLNPAEWEDTKKLLYDNRQLLTEQLDENQKANTNKLIGFFKEIDTGDQIIIDQPLTADNLASSLMFYERAQQKAEALPESIDIAFIAQLKINENNNLRSKLEAEKQHVLAAETYNKILDGLNPSEWEYARKLLYDNRQFLTEQLDENQKANTNKLIGFFKEIDTGDQIIIDQPLTTDNLTKALLFYERAQEKVEALPESIDIAFIAQLKINENNNLKTKLEAKRQELLAAQRAEAEYETSLKKPDVEKVDQYEIAEKKYTRSEKINQAAKYFKERNYVSSLTWFEKVYTKQINNIKHGGKKQIMGILALPIKYRAEIIFLIELDRLMGKNKNDDDELIREGLEELYDNIENGIGLWAIIPESKRNKIIKHIDALL